MEHFLKIGENIPAKEIWRDLIAKWRSLMNDYITRYNIEETNEKEKDLPYWWNEYANGGFLAGAVWLSGGSVLEEFGVERSKEDSINDKSKGRCDFWIGVHDLRCYIETKIKIVSTLSETTTLQIKNVLDKAKVQLEKIEDRNDIGIAICFIIPCLKEPSSSSQNDTKRIFEEIIKEFNTENNIIATYFSPDNSQTEDLDEGCYYPGVAFVGELVSVKAVIR